MLGKAPGNWRGFSARQEQCNGSRLKQSGEFNPAGGKVTLRRDLIERGGTSEARYGEVTEWPKVPVSKTGVGVTRPWVRLPPSPPAFAHLRETLRRASAGKPTVLIKTRAKAARRSIPLKATEAEALAKAGFF